MTDTLSALTLAPHRRPRRHTHPKLNDKLVMPDFATLSLDTDSKIAKRLRQKELSMVVNCACWVDLLDAANSFDAANAGASVRHREARHAHREQRNASAGIPLCACAAASWATASTPCWHPASVLFPTPPSVRTMR